MEVVIHGHQTDVTPELRQRAEDGARKLADHLRRVESADITFQEDGVKKTVDIILLAPNTRLVAKGEAKFHEPALNEAIAKLDAQIRRIKSARKKRLHETELRA